MTQPGPIIVGGLLVFGAALQASAQPPAVAAPENATVAFLDVNLIRLDRERVETGQTVLTRGDRITAIGPRSAVTVPDDAIVIQGEGRYLTPGLTDAHVHLVGDGTGFGGAARPDFGDAPLYLAYGVTTVFNLRGTPEQLDWRRRIESGELVGPSIYTSGRFVNEPRVNSPDEVRDEITAQARDGYDLRRVGSREAGAAGGSAVMQSDGNGRRWRGKFPHEDSRALGYHAVVHGEKGWNGVAVLSRAPEASAVRSVMPSTWACATRMRSNGSLWSGGNESTTTAARCQLPRP